MYSKLFLLYIYFFLLCTLSVFFKFREKNYYAPFYTFLVLLRRIKDELSIRPQEIMVSWSHRLLARRELSKFPINPITYKRARSRHNRCSLWRFDWTLIKHSLSTATASIPHWKVGRDRRYWFREYYHGLEKRWVFWVQTAAAVIYHSKRAREWEAEYREVLCLGDWSPLFRSPSSLSLFFLALTLDIIYSLSFSLLFLHLHYNSVDFPLGTDRR